VPRESHACRRHCRHHHGPGGRRIGHECAQPHPGVRNVGLTVKCDVRPAPVHLRLFRSPPAAGGSRRDGCLGRQRGGATRCGALPAARMVGRLPTRTPANPGANRTSGRFIGASWSIVVSLSDVDGRARTARRTIESEHVAGPMGACAVLAVPGRPGAGASGYAGERVGCAATGMSHALAGGRLGDVVRATCRPSCGPPV
jgi:hypothetical protein